MTNDPARLSHRVGTQNRNAFRVRGSARSGATGGLFIQSPAFGREAPQPGSGCDYSRSFRCKGHLAQLSRGFCTLAGLSLATTLPVVSVPCCLMAGLSVRD